MLKVKRHRIMKTLQYLLIICTLTIATAAFSQAKFKTAEDKEAFEHINVTEPYEFKSTSTMSGSGSNLPIAARNSAMPDSNEQAQSPRRPYKAPPITGGEDMPVGDGMWVLLLMAMLFCGVKYLRRKQALKS